jgi:superfamily II DNA or RNA helicase
METLLGISKEKLDTVKYVMQLRCVNLWIKNNARGTIEAATGVGKSIIGCLAIKKMVLLNNERQAIVVVPTLQLKGQWESLLDAVGLGNNTEVYVINSIALNDKVYQADLLVIDEIHMMAADKFSRIFQLVKYNWLMGLTATVERLDGKEILLKRYAPIVETISQKKAIEKGWINDFLEINVPVYLTRDEKVGLANLSKKIRMYTAKFGDFDSLRSCMNSKNAYAYACLHYPGEDPKEKSRQLTRDAVQAQRSIKQRQEFLYKTEHKVQATVDLINEFGLKTITFSQSTAFADEVKQAVGRRAVAYHSNLETVTKKVTKRKNYKTKDGAEKYAKKVKGKVERKSDRTYDVVWKIPKKVGSTALKKESLTRFSESSHGIDVICTAKALDQGFDVPDVQLGIDASRTSNPTQHTQRTGRIARNYTYRDGTQKQGIYVNFFVPDSQDENWLRRSQRNSERVIWVGDLDECITLIKTALSNGNVERT